MEKNSLDTRDTQGKRETSIWDTKDIEARCMYIILSIMVLDVHVVAFEIGMRISIQSIRISGSFGFGISIP